MQTQDPVIVCNKLRQSGYVLGRYCTYNGVRYAIASYPHYSDAGEPQVFLRPVMGGELFTASVENISLI